MELKLQMQSASSRAELSEGGESEEGGVEQGSGTSRPEVHKSQVVSTGRSSVDPRSEGDSRFLFAVHFSFSLIILDFQFLH